MLPILAWVWLAARDPMCSVFLGGLPRYVLSGEILRDRFSTVHAGFAMDQPTIGKWLFWFTFMVLTCLPMTLLVRALTDRRPVWSWRLFAVGNLVLCACLLAMLSWPLTWLVHYIYSMGITPRRIFGLLYASAGMFGVIAFFVWSVRKPHEQGATRPVTDT